MDGSSGEFLFNEVLDFFIENQDESTTNSSENVGKWTLEEWLISTFLLIDFLSTIKRSSIEDFSTTRLHHHSSSDGIKWIWGNTSQGSNGLGNNVLNKESLIFQFEDTISRIEHSEVDSSVEDDTPNWDDESLIETSDTISSGDLLQTIKSSVELSLSSWSNISSQSGSNEIQWVDKEQWGGSSSSSWEHRSEEVLNLLSLWVEWAEPISVGILEGKVQGLGWEISHDVGHVSSP